MSARPWLNFSSDNDPDQIRLMHHDARWRQEYEQTRSSILQSCEGRVVAVEHIGSTAISGLIARPIIDAVAVVADPMDLSDASLLIEGLNFRGVPIPGWASALGPAEILEKPRHGEITHRVFVVSQGSPILRLTVELRDKLRSCPETAIDFEEAKVEIWRQTDGQHEGYHQAMSRTFERFT